MSLLLSLSRPPFRLDWQHVKEVLAQGNGDEASTGVPELTEAEVPRSYQPQRFNAILSTLLYMPSRSVW